jgi:hypothetical protein
MAVAIDPLVVLDILNERAKPRPPFFGTFSLRSQIHDRAVSPTTLQGRQCSR